METKDKRSFSFFRSRFGRSLLQSKYIFSLLLMLLSLKTSADFTYVLFGAAEMVLVFLLSELLIKRNATAAYLLNSILLLLLNIQFGILLFSGAFLQPIMLSNVLSVRMLEGKLVRFCLTALLVLGFSFIPIYAVSWSRSSIRGFLSSALAVELVMTMVFGSIFSPFYGIADTIGKEIGSARDRRRIGQMSRDEERFLKSGILQYRAKPDTIGDRPNIILIFTEGLSQEIISDSRNIMPNVRDFQRETLSFEHYYNHTFATYRGIIGSLFSGYQYLNLDSNRLISFQGILKDRGYHTCFINTEPDNAAFTGYLEHLGFDEVIDHVTGECDYRLKNDKEAYELLTAYLTRNMGNEQPWLTCIYTVGTHMTFDSEDEQYGDGSDRFLNRFYNLDCQFGSFLSWFKESGLYDSTILVFTTDHATFADEDYVAVFDRLNEREIALGRIPLLIYYPGVEAETLDAMGRNSLDLVPTLCDLLDIDCENYFLGSTLFCNVGEANNSYETVFLADTDGSIRNTINGSIDSLDEQQKEILLWNIKSYFATAREKNEDG